MCVFCVSKCVYCMCVCECVFVIYVFVCLNMCLCGPKDYKQYNSVVVGALKIPDFELEKL